MWCVLEHAVFATGSHHTNSHQLTPTGGHTELVKWLVKKGCSMTEKTLDGDTALLLACYCGHSKLVRWILDNGGSMNERNNSGLTPLISAANGGHPDVVDALMERGAYIDEVDDDGYTALLLSARRGYLPTVQALGAYGADTSRRTKHGLDAIALSFEHSEVKDWLLRTRDFTPLHVAALIRSPQHAKRLLFQGADPTALTLRFQQPTPLQLALTPLTDLEPGLVRPSAAIPVVCQETMQILRQASALWTPSTHHLFGPRFRKTSFQIMLLANRLGYERLDLPELPTELWFRIIAMVGRDMDRQPITTV
jgi:hypothetical protein